MIITLCQRAGLRGGRSILLNSIGSDKSLSYTNPSIMKTQNGFLICLKEHNYTLFAGEARNIVNSPYGNFAHITHDGQPVQVQSKNIIVELNRNLEVIEFGYLDTSNNDAPPQYPVVRGLEDPRIVKWDDQIILIGNRGDANTKGLRTIELSYIEKSKDSSKYTETARYPIVLDEKLHEKNWMPFADLEFRFVRYVKPSQIIETSRNGIIKSMEGTGSSTDLILRGGTQVITWEEYYIAFSHSVNRTKKILEGKNQVVQTKYLHHLVVWNKKFQLLGHSPEGFSIAGFPVEFASGAAVTSNSLLMTYGIMDQTSGIVELPKELVYDLLEEALA